jgi:hypothetical protein
MKIKTKNILLNITGVILGFMLGGLLNGFMINQSSSIIPPPVGTDLTTEDGLKAAMKLMQPKHFLIPFLAHAFGSLFGAIICSFIAKTHKLILSMMVGFVFFLGGWMMIMALPSPLWFSFLDLGFAYFPMSWLGYKFASSLKK